MRDISKQLSRTSRQASEQRTQTTKSIHSSTTSKKKFIIIVNALMVALCSHLALASTIGYPSLMLREDDLDLGDNTTVATNFGNVVSSVLDDGKKKIEFFDVDGTLEVTAIETEDGTATFYDAEGKEVNLADLDDDDENLEKRVSKWRLAIRFAKLIAKFGKRAWSYIYCVRTAPFWRCGDQFLDCATAGRAPWNCYEGAICVGWNVHKHCR